MGSVKSDNESIEMNHTEDIYYDDNGNDGEDGDGEDGANALHSSTATVTSSTTSQTSSNSRKSRRSSKLSDKMFPSYDPMYVATQDQLKAFSLLVSTPIWIFDFIERKNRYSNQAGLELWSSPNLEEFLNRSMTDMSTASAARTQECQNRIESGQVVQDMWTFYPKGKARTVQMSKGFYLFFRLFFSLPSLYR